MTGAGYDIEHHAVYASETPGMTSLAREKERFGGIKLGAAFFGWLTAIGTVVLLTAVVGAPGLRWESAPERPSKRQRMPRPRMLRRSASWAPSPSLWCCSSRISAGGYVAGRMARFSGALQGLAVWLWGIIVAVVVAVVTLIAGSQWDILATLDGFPRIPVTPETTTMTGILTAVVAAAIALAGAVLGGMAGMRYHRKVDRVGLGQDAVTR